MKAEKIVIAVDGPAASGKGTLARRLASFYGLAFLDTGSLYRGVGWLAGFPTSLNHNTHTRVDCVRSGSE